MITCMLVNAFVRSFARFVEWKSFVFLALNDDGAGETGVGNGGGVVVERFGRETRKLQGVRGGVIRSGIRDECANVGDGV